MTHSSMVDELLILGESRFRDLFGAGGSGGYGSENYDQAWIDEWQHLEPIWAMEPHHEFMRRLFWRLGYLWAWMALWWALLAGTALGNAYAQIAAAGVVAFCYGTCGMIAWRMTRVRRADIDDDRVYLNLPQADGYFASEDRWNYTQDWQEQEER